MERSKVGSTSMAGIVAILFAHLQQRRHSLEQLRVIIELVYVAGGLKVVAQHNSHRLLQRALTHKIVELVHGILVLDAVRVERGGDGGDGSNSIGPHDARDHHPDLMGREKEGEGEGRRG